MNLSQQKPLNRYEIKKYFKTQQFDMDRLKLIQREMFITEC